MCCPWMFVRVRVPVPTHCTIMRLGFRARWIDYVECGLFSIHAPLRQTTLGVGRVSVWRPGLTSPSNGRIAINSTLCLLYTHRHTHTHTHIYIYIYMPVAVHDGCGSVAFVYWLRLKQSVVPMKAQSHLWLTFWELFRVWGCLVVVFTALLCLCVQWKVFRLSEERNWHTISLLSFSRKLRYVPPWWCMSREGPACGQNTLHRPI